MAYKASTSTQISKCKDQHTEVRAVAGSGKTSTLLKRVQHFIDSGVRADEILVLSFSKAAVKELCRRMASTNTNLSQVTVKTAHAFACSLIGQRKVMTDETQKRFLSKAIKVVQKQCPKGKRWSSLSKAGKDRCKKQLVVLGEKQNLSYVLKFFGVARAANMTLLQTAEKPQFSALLPYIRVLGAVRDEYSAIKAKTKRIDYGDMLFQATEAIQSGSAHIPYKHILVDEYQDCSPAQVQMLVALARCYGPSMMVFGDPGQAIYGFGGSCYTPLASVLEGVKQLSLPVSHRLTVENAALASAILQLPPDQAIQAQRHGIPPVLVTSGGEIEQAERIAHDIQQLLAAGAQPEHIAVLGRVKALLQPIEQLLLADNVDTRQMGVLRHKKHALRTLHLVDLVARSEKNKTNITVETLRRALPRLVGVDDCLWMKAVNALKKVCRVPSLEGRYRLCGKAYLRLQGGVRHDRDRLHDVNRWEPFCRAYSTAKQMRDALRSMPKAGVVTGTIHAAKGMEWEHVFVVGTTDGYLPIYHAHEDESQLGEERNLLYVAVTRARETLRLYHAPCNHARSRQSFDTLCRFLESSAVRKVLKAE